MIVPSYWAEARVQHREAGKQVTVRRFGWSDTSQDEAQTNAEVRAAEALRRLLAGEKLRRSEPRVPYNGADGVPIREEVIARHGETVITRNSYGALCLNTPDVLFADVDLVRATPLGLGCALAGVGAACAAWLAWGKVGPLGGIFLVLAGGIAGAILATLLGRVRERLAGGLETCARRRIDQWIAAHPEWRLRVYRTPNGFRLLAMHGLFAATDPEVTEFFAAIGTDLIYARMCRNQQCFRARVSPKPWRVGLERHIRPRPGTWPVRPETMPLRREWVAAYDAKSAGYAAARFENEIGTGHPHDTARAVQQIHDQLCRASDGLPIA